MVNIVNSELLSNGTNGSVNATAYCEPNSAKCHVKFSDLSPYADYEVFSTDYDNYAVIYGCQSLKLAKLEFMWVLSRD